MIIIPLPNAPTPHLPTCQEEDGSRSSSISRGSRSRSSSPSKGLRRSSRQASKTQSGSPDSVSLESVPKGEDPKALKYEVPIDVPLPPFGKPTKDMERDLGRLYEAVSGARRIAVICGAGISVSSPANIPDFRSASGLFKKLKEQHPTAGLSSGKDLFDARLFNSESTSSLFYAMIAELKRLADEAQPTIFHRLLKRLDNEGRLQRIYTQNIDGLEEKAGLTFGLGETGDSTSTFRALGKRKRLEANQSSGSLGSRTGNWSRSKSDSALLWAKRQSEASQATGPMFPRTIPLHGTLSTLTCPLCSHKLSLSSGRAVAKDNSHGDGSLPPGIDPLELLREGQPVPCPRCEVADEVRTANNLRSRGVGRMKVDVVLYGGQNDGAERVGECLQRDILGLRDPLEPPVPESAAETRARERREQKQAEKARQEEFKSSIKVEKKEEGVQGGATDVFSPAGDFGGQKSADEVLRAAFDDGDTPPPDQGKEEQDDDDDDEKVEPGPSGTFFNNSVEEEMRRSSRPARLKPLPPDLLIVAGTSLKVPGTKRIVREFAKACHARDHRVYFSDSDSEVGTSDTNSSRKQSFKSRSKEARAASTDDDREGSDTDEDDLNAPIRTILLNYDFPVPAREWEDVFDVWVQGDLQRAALGLFPTLSKASKQEWEKFKDEEEVVLQHTWAPLQIALEEQRSAFKRKGRKSGSLPQRPTRAEPLKTGSTVETPSGQQASPIKKKRAVSTSAIGKGTQRSTSKKVVKETIAESEDQDEVERISSSQTGKAKGGVRTKGASAAGKSSATNAFNHGRGHISVVVPSLQTPPTPPPSTPSANSTPEPETAETSSREPSPTEGWEDEDSVIEIRAGLRLKKKRPAAPSRVSQDGAVMARSKRKAGKQSMLSHIGRGIKANANKAMTSGTRPKQKRA
ncbi:DHS-like NAD/FAD-binding domain-containing protein [Violaceomyces palustris]|uniref:DHS-like NAD/FAD-binding domain-containing protein n=1 Tax=Violaceomyces palustris TaxID=1673888 RepID=A0ACD0P8U2_9BASI|nr:DHS-like NAD/FAD-binding domain-containing protein [Violaceomyces palustris]